MIAPSDMMDGRIGVIRDALDEEGYDAIPIMAYSAKYASVFYGPFREAAECVSALWRIVAHIRWILRISEEALREVSLDIEEGADIVMVKPAALLSGM